MDREAARATAEVGTAMVMAAMETVAAVTAVAAMEVAEEVVMAPVAAEGSAVTAVPS